MLEEDNRRRTSIARTYTSAFQDLRFLKLPISQQHSDNAWHLYVVRHPKREAFIKHLAESGVGSMIHYPIPPHLQQAYFDLGYSNGAFPISEEIHSTCISLPMGPTMIDSEVDQVINKVRSAYGACT
jgi:dTDP-4-amino-4,6-dideoxygalactose transaminase